MTGRAWCAALALLAGCSKLSGPKGAPVALELRLPSPPAVEPNDTLQLRARAIDENGDSIAASIFWRVADTTLVLVDSNGLVTTTLTSGTGRVQAHVGSLFTSLSSGQLTIRPRSDTLVVGRADTVVVNPADTVVVVDPDTATVALLAAVLSNNPAGGVSGTTILFAVDSTDLQRIADSAHFAGGLSAVRVVTGTDGAPLTAVTLRRTSSGWKDTIHVRVSATRPSGITVPGSDAEFTILFQ